MIKQVTGFPGRKNKPQKPFTSFDELPLFLSVAEVMRLLRLSEPTVLKQIQSGKIPSVRVGDHGEYRIPKSWAMSLFDCAQTEQS